MKIKDLVLKIDSLSFNEVLEYLVKKASGKSGKTFVVTVNTEIIMLARSDPEYEKVIRSVDLALVDGIGVVWAGKMFGKSFKGRVHGSDLIDKVCRAVAEKPITVGFLGGKQNVAQKTADCLKSKYPGLNVVFAVEEWEDRGPAVRFPPASARSRLTDLRAVGSPSSDVTPRCDILFVALGSPKQEKWIAQNLPKIDVRVAIGVGGAFDFVSGKVRRAPVWVRSLGLEWLFRLIIQPWRIKRQLALINFIVLVLKEKLI